MAPPTITPMKGKVSLVQQCSVGAHASCAPDGKGAPHLCAIAKHDDPLDSGFHCDTSGGSPAEAMRDVMRQAVEYLAANSLDSKVT
jgi:hypothetical protein